MSYGNQYYPAISHSTGYGVYGLDRCYNAQQVLKNVSFVKIMEMLFRIKIFCFNKARDCKEDKTLLLLVCSFISLRGCGAVDVS